MKKSLYRLIQTFFDLRTELFSEVQCLDDCTVAFNVNLLQVVQQTTTFTNQTQQRTVSVVVIVIALEVLSQVSDASCEQCNLTFR
jgi:hypothetical protein